MPRFLLPIVTLVILSSCVQDTPQDGTTDTGDVQSLQNKVEQLELDNAMKDSIINESLAFFNEIKSNLEAIGIRKDEIRAISEHEEISSDDKDWILEEIKHINFLREENTQLVKRLQRQLKDNGLKIEELEIMIESLLKDIQWKDEQISLLQDELHKLDQEYSVLFDAYQEQAMQIDLITDEMNAVHYAYGTAEELSSNGVIEKKNGFLGIGRKTELKEEMNDKYFTEIDATKTKKIMIEGTDIHFITYHPKSSYELIKDGGNTRLLIRDASEFWKISKYLVVIVD